MLLFIHAGITVNKKGPWYFTVIFAWSSPERRPIAREMAKAVEVLRYGLVISSNTL